MPSGKQGEHSADPNKVLDMKKKMNKVVEQIDMVIEQIDKVIYNKGSEVKLQRATDTLKREMQLLGEHSADTNKVLDMKKKIDDVIKQIDEGIKEKGSVVKLQRAMGTLKRVKQLLGNDDDAA